MRANPTRTTLEHARYNLMGEITHRVAHSLATNMPLSSLARNVSHFVAYQ